MACCMCLSVCASQCISMALTCCCGFAAGNISENRESLRESENFWNDDGPRDAEYPSGTYYGELDLDSMLPNGQGTFTYKDGRVYCGDFKFGKPHGRGKMEHRNENIIYEGSFQDGEMVGTIMVTYPDKSHYQGDINARLWQNFTLFG